MFFLEETPRSAAILLAGRRRVKADRPPHGLQDRRRRVASGVSLLSLTRPGVIGSSA
jgi:hypothetical protein